MQRKNAMILQLFLLLILFPHHQQLLAKNLRGAKKKQVLQNKLEKPSAERKKEDSKARKKIKLWKINKILSMTINSSINPATFDYLSSGFEKGKKESYDLILIKMNTPGGLVSTTKDILTLMGASSIPSVVWVSPEAASATSAGAIIASGAHLLFMAPGTNIGAATPIGLGSDIKKGDARNKAINDLVALVQSLAEARGRNPKPFAEMIKNASSYKASEALEQKLINGIISSENDLKKALLNKKINLLGKTYRIKPQAPKITEHEMNHSQKLLNILANPNLAYILFILGAALMYLEFQTGGTLIFASIGALCLLLAGIGFQILPLNFGALGLLLLAFILFILEAYITSYGILSLAGLTSLIIGSLFLFRTDDSYLSISKGIIIATVSSISLFLLALAYYIYYDMKKNKPRGNYYNLSGDLVKIVSLLEKNHDEKYYYQVKISGEIWTAYSKKEYKVGDKCKVISQDKNNMNLEI